MKTWTLALPAMLLAACAAVPTATQQPRFASDALFAPPSERVDAGQVFALSDEMRRYVADQIAARARVKGRPVALIDALYAQSELKLTYDSSMTRNAAEAFASRSGNCLSLVIMTAAFAKELGLGVRYQKVFVDDALGRDGDIYMAIGHVNLTLATHKTDESIGFRVGKRPPESEAMTVDFLPQDDLRGMRAQGISEATVVAMYMNNRAVEALARSQRSTTPTGGRARRSRRLRTTCRRTTRSGSSTSGTAIRGRPSRCCATCSSASRVTRRRCPTLWRCSRRWVGARNRNGSPPRSGGSTPSRRSPGTCAAWRLCARAISGPRGTRSRGKSRVRPTTTSSISGWRLRSWVSANATRRARTWRSPWRTVRPDAITTSMRRSSGD